jgi:hypothetical protein
MKQTPPEVATAALLFIAFWMITVLVILIAGQVHPAMRGFRNQMVGKWKSALVIAGLFILGMGLGGRGWLNPYAIAIFCQALIGLAIASSIEGFQPLPVANAFMQRKQILLQVVLLVVISVAVVVPALLIGTIGLDIGRQIFGEADYTSEAVNTLPPNKWLLLRFWRVSRKRLPVGNTFSHLESDIKRGNRYQHCAGAYHPTPSVVCTHCNFCIGSSPTLIGLVWGYRSLSGYGQPAGHTLALVADAFLVDAEAVRTE